MNKIEELKEFVKLNDIELTPQQLIFAEYLYDHQTVCLTIAYREWQMPVINAIAAMEQKC